jgi:hypothetical protein
MRQGSCTVHSHQRTEGARKAQSASDIWLKDAKYRAPESPNGNITPEADVWCLGATLFEAITQKECGADCRNEASRLPVPFGSIVHRCLYSNPEARCTLQEVVQLYEGRLRAFSAAAGAGAGAGSGVGELRDAPRSIPLPARDHAEPLQALPSEGATGHLDAEHAGRLPRRMWAYLAVALLLVLGLIWLARPKKSAQRGSAASSVINTAAPRQQSAAPAQKTAPLANRQATPQHAPAQVSNATTPTAAVNSARPHRDRSRQLTTDQAHYVNGPVWRVVVYTYDVAADAETSARLINERHPDLKAEVFSPNGNSGPYLVVIGGQMDRENAIKLRQKARQLGLPRDTYAQNYKQ